MHEARAINNRAYTRDLFGASSGCVVAEARAEDIGRVPSTPGADVDAGGGVVCCHQSVREEEGGERGHELLRPCQGVTCE